MINLIKHQLGWINNFVLTSLFCIAIASCGNGSKTGPAVSPTDLVNAANELDSLFLIAFNKGDAEGITKLYWNSPELQLYPPGENKITGFESVKKWYVKNFESTKGAKLEYISANNVSLDNVVVAHGVFRWSLPVEGNPPMILVCSYSEVKAFKDGRMVIILDHSSMPFEIGSTDSTLTK